MENTSVYPYAQIRIDPAIQGGRPVIEGTRVPLQVILGSLAGGMTVPQVCEQYRVTEPQVRAALSYAADTLADQRVMVLE